MCLDTSGNMARASDPYAQAQDAASACRLFYNELWYGPTRGIRYFEEILGHGQPIAILKARLVEAALTVPGVLTAVVYLTAVKARSISGQVQITTAAGEAIVTL